MKAEALFKVYCDGCADSAPGSYTAKRATNNARAAGYRDIRTALGRRTLCPSCLDPAPILDEAHEPVGGAT